jgi:hypothetical protein
VKVSRSQFDAAARLLQAENCRAIKLGPDRLQVVRDIVCAYVAERNTVKPSTFEELHSIAEAVVLN